MEKTFYVYESKAVQQVYFYLDPATIHPDGPWRFLGTVTLPVVPPLKEVVKEAPAIPVSTTDTEKLISAVWVPKDAYDIKLTYKVKE